MARMCLQSHPGLFNNTLSQEEKFKSKSDIVANACNTGIQEIEAGLLTKF